MLAFSIRTYTNGLLIRFVHIHAFGCLSSATCFDCLTTTFGGRSFHNLQFCSIFKLSDISFRSIYMYMLRVFIFVCFSLVRKHLLIVFLYVVLLPKLVYCMFQAIPIKLRCSVSGISRTIASLALAKL